MALQEAATNDLTNGPAAAAILAAGVGSFVLGLLTTLAAASEPIKAALNWYAPAGSLTGKTSLAVLVWLVSWIILHVAWKDRELAFGRVFIGTLLLIGLGVLGTFPPIFELFE